MRRSILALVGVALVLAAAFLGWRHVGGLEERIAELGRRVETLDEEVLETKRRAEDAESRADRAEERAAREQARAESAERTARERSSEAEQEAAARTEAEQIARAEKEARERARRETLQEERARREAEAAREVAEQERLDAVLEKLEAEETARAAEQEAERLRRERERELGRLQGALSRIAATRRTALGVVMSLDERHVEFDFDEADLRPVDRELLSRIAGVLLTFEDFSIEVVGHTDRIGTAEYNQELSERRAEAVRDYLVEIGVDPEAISARGMGESSPLVEGTDEESHQRNRRVELAITLVESHPGPLTDDEGG